MNGNNDYRRKRCSWYNRYRNSCPNPLPLNEWEKEFLNGLRVVNGISFIVINGGKFDYTCWNCNNRMGEARVFDGHDVYIDSEICEDFESVDKEIKHER